MLRSWNWVRHFPGPGPTCLSWIKPWDDQWNFRNHQGMVWKYHGIYGTFFREWSTFLYISWYFMSIYVHIQHRLYRCDTIMANCKFLCCTGKLTPKVSIWDGVCFGCHDYWKVVGCFFSWTKLHAVNQHMFRNKNPSSIFPYISIYFHIFPYISIYFHIFPYISIFQSISSAKCFLNDRISQKKHSNWAISISRPLGLEACGQAVEPFQLARFARNDDGRGIWF